MESLEIEAYTYLCFLAVEFQDFIVRTLFCFEFVGASTVLLYRKLKMAHYFRETIYSSSMATALTINNDVSLSVVVCSIPARCYSYSP